MADSGEKTEKPTQRRLEKARKEGNFPSSKEFVSAIQFLGFVIILVSYSSAWLMSTMRVTRVLLDRAFTIEITPAVLVSLARHVIVPQFTPLLMAGGALVLVVFCTQMGVTKLGISVSKLAPDLKRLNPLKKLTSLPGQNLPLLLQAMVLLPMIGWAVYYEAKENLDSMLELPWMAAPSALARVGGTLEVLLWRAAALFLLVGVVDLVWQRSRYNKQLKMSKQEIRDEGKDQAGNPHVKARIRRLRRDLSRRRMMQDVPTATAIIVNPTHFAVAIRYSIDSSAAPRVVAKGKNFLAARIRKLAVLNQVPIVENPPLAQALYKAVDIGQEIPSHLYRAVAEILAYIYRMTNGNMR